MDVYEKMFYSALRIRMVEERIVEIYPTDKIQSPVHLSIGQEHHVVALCEALRPEDQLFTTYRNHAAYLAKGGDIKLMMSELYGKYTGVSKGKAGSMHLSFPKRNLMGSSAIVGSVFSHALGAAYAIKINKKDRIVVVIAGDGATEEGVFHECMNFASLKNLPLLLVIENNGLAIHSRIEKRQSYNLMDLTRAYKIDSVLFEDGFNMDTVYSQALRVRDKILTEQRPFLFEIKTYRYKAHVGIIDDYDQGYRDRSEFQRWHNKDPLVIDEPLINKYKTRIKQEIDDAVSFAEESPFPDCKELLKDVY